MVAVELDTENHFRREGIDLQTNKRVVRVEPGAVTIRHPRSIGTEETIPFGLCVWSTGMRGFSNISCAKRVGLLLVE